jgi:hypothetical protein
MPYRAQQNMKEWIRRSFFHINHFQSSENTNTNQTDAFEDKGPGESNFTVDELGGYEFTITCGRL